MTIKVGDKITDENGNEMTVTSVVLNADGSVQAVEKVGKIEDTQLT